MILSGGEVIILDLETAEMLLSIATKGISWMRQHSNIPASSDLSKDGDFVKACDEVNYLRKTIRATEDCYHG